MLGQLAVLSVPSLSLASSSTIAQLSVPIIQAAERHFTWINHHFHHQSQQHVNTIKRWFEVYRRIFPEIFGHSQSLTSQVITKLQHMRLKKGEGWVSGYFLLCWRGEKVQLVGAQASVTDRGGQMSYDVDNRWACVTERCPAQYVQHCQHHRSQHHHYDHNRWVSVTETHS